MCVPNVAFVLVLAATCSSTAESPPQPRDSSAVEAVCRGNTAFAVDLYHRVAVTPGNVFFSPLSLSSALAMTYAGAKGETAQQMARTLYFLPDQEGMCRAFGDLTQDFNSRSPDYELSVANAL